MNKKIYLAPMVRICRITPCLLQISASGLRTTKESLVKEDLGFLEEEQGYSHDNVWDNDW